MMQDYGNPPSRNTIRAASADLKSGKAIGGGGNATQGAGTIPSKVNVPLPGTNKVQPREGGGMRKAPAGFNNGLINGKI